MNTHIYKSFYKFTKNIEYDNVYIMLECQLWNTFYDQLMMNNIRPIKL